MSVLPISFTKALNLTADTKRHLLLGNGFSIALFRDRFSYVSLLENADFTHLPEARKAFDLLGTTDFEVVIHALRQSIALLPLYSVDSEARSRMEKHAETLKELLVQAIAGRHPERPSDVNEAQYHACRIFLAHFAGETRNLKPNRGKDLRANIYTLNYDLLLYWTLLHDQVIDWNATDPLASVMKSTEALQHDDGFRAPDDDPEAAYVAWDGEETHHQTIYFLHGGLHIYDYGHELQKKCWERSGGIPLVDQIRASLNEGRFPLFVSEGSSQGKFERIRHSAYLHKGLRSFAEICRSTGASLFIFGHSLASNDAHILKQIEKGKIGQIYVSLYGNPASDSNRGIIARAQRMATVRDQRYPLNVRFFDAGSANVWGEAA
jgi:Domain of unknown function (DUF4917)